MSVKRIVIIGGPGTGKTSLINALAADGHHCLEEISRQVTRKAQQEGITQLFLTDPLLFSQKLLEHRIQQFRDATSSTAQYVFIDRGIPDVVAYLDYANQTYPKEFWDSCTTHVYDHIFVLPIWEDIYTSDNERYENLEQAIAIQKMIEKTYKKLGYTLLPVPKTTVEARKNFILNALNTL